MFNDRLEALFRKCDVRGTVEEGLNQAFARGFGLGYASLLSKNETGPYDSRPKVAIGWDCRSTSPELATALMTSLVLSGVDVVSLGMCPSPVVYSFVKGKKLDGGLVVTGSHHDASTNGIKAIIEDRPLSPDELKRLQSAMRKNLAFFNTLRGMHTDRDPIPEYVSDIAQRFEPKKTLKVLVDCGSGTAGMAVSRIFRLLGIQAVLLNADPNCLFPYRNPDPLAPGALASLSMHVSNEKADCGIAFDPDADRLAVVDDTGRALSSEELMALFALDIKEHQEQARIVLDVRTRKAVYEFIQNQGLKVNWSPTGRSLIQEKMKEEGADFGGENSGHFYFRDKYYGFDDAIYASLRLLSILWNSEKKLSNFLTSFPKEQFRASQLLKMPKDSVRLELGKAKEYLWEHYKVLDVDGVRIDTSDGFLLLRESVSQPGIYLEMVSNSPEGLAALGRQTTELLKQFKLDQAEMSL